jgi:hypothetical protein
MYGQDMIDRWQEVMEQIRQAAVAAGRDPREVGLVAVSKNHPAEAVSALAAAGQRDFGENYVQEALDKRDHVPDDPIRWHFIGRLQTNKAKFLAGRFELIHSLDREKMARALHDKCLERQVVQPVLLQVNIGREEQKGGVAERETVELARLVAGLNGLDLQGLMCMPPFFDSGDQARPFFAQLRQIKERLESELGRSLPHLSMGMSGDFPAAIAEGATLVRIGTSIFGAREG